MSAKQEKATTRFCFILEVEGWEPVVYTSIETIYMLMEATAISLGNTLDKTLGQVKDELSGSFRKSTVHEVHNGQPTKGFYTIKRAAFVHTEVTK